jgi:hypothetical protein
LFGLFSDWTSPASSGLFHLDDNRSPLALLSFSLGKYYYDYTLITFDHSALAHHMQDENREGKSLFLAYF